MDGTEWFHSMTLNRSSEAQILIESECAPDCWSKIRPWDHELWFHDEDGPLWYGPIFTTQPLGDGFYRITGFDRSARTAFSKPTADETFGGPPVVALSEALNACPDVCLDTNQHGADIDYKGTWSLSRGTYLSQMLTDLSAHMWWTVRLGTLTQGALNERPYGITLADDMFNEPLQVGSTGQGRFNVIRVYYGDGPNDFVQYPPGGHDPETDGGAGKLVACYSMPELDADGSFSVAQSLYELLRFPQSTVQAFDLDNTDQCYRDFLPGSLHFVESGTFNGQLILDSVVQSGRGNAVTGFTMSLVRPGDVAAARRIAGI